VILKSKGILPPQILQMIPCGGKWQQEDDERAGHMQLTVYCSMQLLFLPQEGDKDL